MGARFRLKAGFPISSYRPDTQVVLKAMRRYGLVLADNGSPWYFQGPRTTAGRAACSTSSRRSRRRRSWPSTRRRCGCAPAALGCADRRTSW
jgi:hypothetical protein